MNNSTSTFTFKKRFFLLNKLDEVIKLWACGSGQGSFTFIVKDGNPSLPYGIQLDMQDVSRSVPVQPQHVHLQHPFRPRHRGPARLARDRERAAKHQAALAAATAVSAANASSSQDKAKSVISSDTVQMSSVQTVTPLSFSKLEPVATRVSVSAPPDCTDVPSVHIPTSIVSTTTFSRPVMTPMVAPTMYVNDEFADDESDEDLPCSRCLKEFDKRSTPIGCVICRNVFHTRCKQRHRCLSYTNLNSKHYYLL